MVLYPLIVALVSLVFSFLVFRQWQSRRRPHQLVWTIALVLSWLGALAYIGAAHWQSPFLFRVYYASGALMMAAYLGLGSIYLAAPRRFAHACAWLLGLMTLYGLWALFTTPVDPVGLAALDGGPGVGVLKLSGLGLASLIFMNSFGTLGVGVTALVSAWRVFKHEAPPRFLYANLLIAAGAFGCGAAGSAARLGTGGFWLVMALSFVLLFAGFLLTTSDYRR